jgi:Protein of unknown function (DUF1566)
VPRRRLREAPCEDQKEIQLAMTTVERAAGIQGERSSSCPGANGRQAQVWVASVAAFLAAVVAAGPAQARPLKSWSNKIDDPSRFALALGGGAVLDKESALVWEIEPDGTKRALATAEAHCLNRTVDARHGWRLPSASEVASLFDDASVVGKLPPGHPFVVNLLLGTDFWTTSRLTNGTPLSVSIASGTTASRAATNLFRSWCVRAFGGQNGQ